MPSGQSGGPDGLEAVWKRINIYKKIKLIVGEKDDPAKEKGRSCELEMKAHGHLPDMKGRVS